MRDGVAALIVAAGRGTRAGGDRPKQWRMLAGRPVLARTLAPFLTHPAVSSVVVVIHPDDAVEYATVTADLDRGKLRPPAHGGATRQASVRAGLAALAPTSPEIVLVHDAARPFVDAALIDRAVAAARTHGAAIPVVPVTDTIVQDEHGRAGAIVPRETLRAVQTPQAFRFADLLAAHGKAQAAGREDFGDDGGVMAFAGHAVALFEGDAGNVKLTRPEDFSRAEARIAMETALVTRVATGYDVHAFGPGASVMLGGVEIAHDHGLVGHSDADVVLHALTDAVLGTLGDGDIGSHFPPSDPQWRGASSDRFLAFAAARLVAAGGLLDHADVTIVCEAPRIGPHREAMRARIAAITGVPITAVAVKATTSERLGFTGRREGIAALATVTVRLPAGR